MGISKQSGGRVMKTSHRLIAPIFGMVITSIISMQHAWSRPLPPPSPPPGVQLDGDYTLIPCSIPSPQLLRTTYQKPVVVLPGACKSLATYQVRSCIENRYTEWKGVANNYLVCEEIASSSGDGPLWQISSLSYKGGFRVDAGRQGETRYSSADFSVGIFTVSENGDSIFLVGNPREPRIAEFDIPEIINTRDILEMVRADSFLQEFEIFHDPDTRYDSGIAGFFRFSGLTAIDGKLIVNAFNWYDANGSETDTTSIIVDPNNLATSEIIGPFQLEGAARSAGWITPVPLNWQPRLGGTHVSGWSDGSINSRLSNGPSAYFWNPYEDALNKPVPGPISARVGLTFPLDNILFDYGLYGDFYNGDFSENEVILLNDRLNNDLWTYMSGATYGFIVPGTNTYVTLGSSGGHESGIGYKWQKADGSYCPGHCTKDPEDYYNYYWLWKLSDLEKAVNGESEPHTIRPYDFGVFDTIGSKASFGGGHYNPETGRLIISLRGGDDVSRYARPPLFLVYDVVVNP